MDTILFILFLIGSQAGALLIIGLTSYFRLFWKILPLLILYGLVIAWCFLRFELEGFLYWQAGLATSWLVTNWLGRVRAA